MIYATTEKFLRVFGINSLEDLPKTESLEDIAPNEAVDRAQLQITDEIGNQEEAAEITE
jgi:chromosome segregation and condensation protein ScpB